MADPRVSILMLTYNRPQLIGRAIASACAQTFQEWELIVVQDGSNPTTAELLKEWLAKEPRLRYLPRGTVGCIAEASNAGLKQARGEYIAILDDDDYWSDPEKLARQVEFLDRNPEYAGCGGGYVIVNQDGEKRGMFLKPEDDAAIRRRALLANPIANSTAMFRRVIGGAPALYDPEVRGFADWDFWLSLAHQGKLYNFPTYLAHYALWEGSGSFQASRTNARAAVQIVRKHRGKYSGYGFALLLAYLNLCYAYLPAPVRRVSYGTLSAMKKALASAGK